MMAAGARGNGADERPPDIGITGDVLDEQEYEPLEWLIEGILPIGATLVAGKAKIGKSWLVLDMALAVATGTHCFGKVQARQADVLYLALEDGPSRLQSRQRKLMGTASGPAGIEYFTTWPSIDQGFFDALAFYLENHATCRMVVVDTLGKVRGAPNGRLGVFQQDYSDMGSFQKFAMSHHIALLVVHHARKQGSDDVFDQVSGTTAMQAAPDNVLLLARKRGGTAGILSITGKDIEEEADYALDFDKLTGRWSWLGEAGQVKRDTDQQKVSDLLSAQADPMAPSDIAEELGISRESVKKSLSRLKKLGSVESAAKGLWISTSKNVGDN